MSWLDLLLVGQPGPPGTVWRNGSGAPSNTLGVDGDYYLNTANGDVHKKASGSYSIVGNIAGSSGAGSLWRTGSGVPSNGLGVDGDLYLRTTNGDVYQKASGSYSVVANIKGADGSSTPKLFWSPALRRVTGNVTSNSGNQTSGCKFSLQETSTIVGVRFYWAGGAATVKCSLFDMDASSNVATVDLSVSGAGIQTATFASGYVATITSTIRTFCAAVWDKAAGSGHYTAMSSRTNPSAPFVGGTTLQWEGFRQWGSGDAVPSSVASTEDYLVEPIFG